MAPSPPVASFPPVLQVALPAIDFLNCSRYRLRYVFPWPALFMTVRREIAELRRETCARSREDPKRTRAVR